MLVPLCGLAAFLSLELCVSAALAASVCALVWLVGTFAVCRSLFFVLWGLSGLSCWAQAPPASRQAAASDKNRFMCGSPLGEEAGDPAPGSHAAGAPVLARQACL